MIPKRNFTPPPVFCSHLLKFFDPPRGGLDLCCTHCKASAWIPASLHGVIESFPHDYDCRHFNQGMSGVFVESVTGSPLVTVWEERKL